MIISINSELLDFKGSVIFTNSSLLLIVVCLNPKVFAISLKFGKLTPESVVDPAKRPSNRLSCEILIME